MKETRREFLFSSARLAAWYGVFHLGTSRGAWAGDAGRTTRRWAQQLANLAAGVRSGRLRPEEWQAAIEQLHRKTPLEDLILALDVDRVVRGIEHPKEKLGAVQDVPIAPDDEPRLPDFGHKLFVYRKGACTPPHAHNRLVSAHLVLQGHIRARTFNRLEDLERSMLIEPTADRTLGPGHTVSMSDARDNVHWFEGISSISVSFDVPVGGISPDKKYGHAAEGLHQIFLDPTVPARADGRIDAPVIGFHEAVRKFA